MNTIEPLKFHPNPKGGRNQIIDLPDGAMLSFATEHPFGAFWGPESDEGETALCWKGKHAILNGDHRKPLEAIAHDFEAVKAYFKTHLETEASGYSTLEASDL